MSVPRSNRLAWSVPLVLGLVLLFGCRPQPSLAVSSFCDGAEKVVTAAPRPRPAPAPRRVTAPLPDDAVGSGTGTGGSSRLGLGLGLEGFGIVGPAVPGLAYQQCDPFEDSLNACL